MRLSEAIREGSRGTEQAIGSYRLGKKVCALGAAMKAHGVPLGKSAMDMLAQEEWEEANLHGHPARCPQEGCELEELLCGADVGDIIIHLNDDHEWSREDIADWLQVEEAIHGLGEQAAPGEAQLMAPKELVNAG